MASSTKESRVSKFKATRPQTPRRVRSNGKSPPRVEGTNALSIEKFISQYVSPATSVGNHVPDHATGEAPPAAEQSQHDASRAPPLDVYSAGSISETDLEVCLDLVELTSGEDYAASSMGWSRARKRKEMKLPDMKFLIMRGGSAGPGEGRTGGSEPREGDDDGNNKASDRSDEPASWSGSGMLGFLSFMVTYEDGKEVIYCYEIHLSPMARGRGLGKRLMGHMEEIGRRVGVEKAMLTVFKSNVAAWRFYERVGYGVDEFSPRPYRLRNGTVKDVDYLILSKGLG